MSPSEQRSFSPRAVGGRRFVAFFHPAYPDTAPPLLTLAAIDYVDVSGRRVQGINYHTAKAACGVVACNRFDDNAYFAEKCGNGKRWVKFHEPRDGLLRASGDFTFYFVVDKPDNRYPVVPSFDHWRFPHGALPPQWASMFIPASNADGLSRQVAECNSHGDPRLKITLARVAPFTNSSWTDSNQMEKYCTRREGATSVSALFTEIRRCFHRTLMDSIPDGRDYCANRFELHPELILHDTLDVTVHDHTDWRQADHDNEPLKITGISREHLFARFAFHVLSDANYRFLGGVFKYTVRLFDVDKAEHYTAELDSDEVTELSTIFDDEYDESDDESYDGDNDGRGVHCWPWCHCDSGSDSSFRCSNDVRELRTGRKRYRAPIYHAYKYIRDDESSQEDQEDQDDTNVAQLMKERRSSHNASSIGDVSLSSTRSVSSLETPRSDHTLEDAVGLEDKPGFSTNLIHSKRSYDDYIEAPDISRSPKRVCLQ